MSGLLALISRSVCIDMSQKIVIVIVILTLSGAHVRTILILCLLSILYRCSNAGMWQPCYAYVDIQFWPAQDILPQ